MANKKRHNAAFIVGSVVGGLVGAAAALWKTPYTGEELRGRITGSALQTRSVTGEAGTSTTSQETGTSFKSKVLSTVENTLAPVVGVKLGRTANEEDSASSTRDMAGTRAGTGMGTTASERTSSMGPGAGIRQGAGMGDKEAAAMSDTGAPPAYPDEEPLRREGAGTGMEENVTPVSRGGGQPSRMSPPTRPAGDDQAASVEDLTKPQIDLVPAALTEEEGKMKPFPKLGGTEGD